MTRDRKALLRVSFFRTMSKTYKETHGDYSAEVHLFPFRTEKLSPAAPMILQEMCGKVGRRHPHNGSLSIELGLSCFYMRPHVTLV